MSRDDARRIVSRNLNNLLKAAGISQSELSRRMNVSRDNVHIWITGASLPRKPMIEKMAEALGCKETDLVPEAFLAENRLREPAASSFNLSIVDGGRAHVRADVRVPVEIGFKIAALLAPHARQQAVG